MIDMEIPIHPAAAVFPMLSDDELQELAKDIKANGLLHPIVLDEHGVLVDGRNRLSACNLAGVQPRFETLPKKTDVRAYILSQNVKRRHMKTGQIAMAVALMYDDDISKNGQSSRSGGLIPHGAGVAAEKVYGIPATRFYEAVAVVRYAPHLKERVLLGIDAITTAYAEARQAQRDQESQAEADRRALTEAKAQMERLRTDAPDLADLVDDEKLALAEAMAVLDKREREEQERRERDTLGFARATSYLAALLVHDPTQIAHDWLPAANSYATIAGCETLWSADGLRDLARRLADTADAWKE